MSISPDLMYAILALDAYNRGYDPGIEYVGNSIGTATIWGHCLILHHVFS